MPDFKIKGYYKRQDLFSALYCAYYFEANTAEELYDEQIDNIKSIFRERLGSEYDDKYVTVEIVEQLPYIVEDKGE